MEIFDSTYRNVNAISHILSNNSVVENFDLNESTQGYTTLSYLDRCHNSTSTCSSPLSCCSTPKSYMYHLCTYSDECYSSINNKGIRSIIIFWAFMIPLMLCFIIYTVIRIVKICKEEDEGETVFR